jgi:hypothetical protein
MTNGDLLFRHSVWRFAGGGKTDDEGARDHSEWRSARRRWTFLTPISSDSINPPIVGWSRQKPKLDLRGGDHPSWSVPTE